MRYYEKRVLKTITRERVRRLHRCHECFSPRILPLLFRWDDGGVIALRLINRNLRFAFLENDLLNEILDLLVGHFGEEEVYEIARNTERGSPAGSWRCSSRPTSGGLRLSPWPRGTAS